MTDQYRRIITCACGCGRTGAHHGRGLISACWHREHARGTLHRWPYSSPAPQDRPMRLVAPSVAGRIEDYIELREVHKVSRVEAAARIGRDLRTITRWHAHLRATGADYPWLFINPRTQKQKKEASTAA